MHIIETRGLTRTFGHTEAVHDLDLALAPGGVTALLGPNGAGKSTTIRLLMNLLTPTAGSSRVLGVDSRKLGPREFARIGYVSENQELPLWMTVRGFLDYCRPFYPRWDRELERTLLAQLDLPQDRKLAHLSRGMLMKVNLLSSLAYRPELLVLDEPFAGLDPLVREEFVRGLLEVSGLGDWTVFISSHDIEEVERFCDHVVLLDAGRKQVDESTEKLLARFRRVDVQRPDDTPMTDLSASGWLEIQHSGRRTSFVEPRHEAGETESACAAFFPGANVSVTPMNLREIFLTLAREGRAKNRPQTAAAR